MPKAKLSASAVLALYFLSIAPALAQECTEFWICTDWSFCMGSGKQIRTCSDINRCGTDRERPLETQDCAPYQSKDIVLPERPQGPEQATGAFLTSTSTILGIVALVLLVVAYVTYRKWKDIRMFVSSV